MKVLLESVEDYSKRNFDVNYSKKLEDASFHIHTFRQKHASGTVTIHRYTHIRSLKDLIRLEELAGRLTFEKLDEYDILQSKPDIQYRITFIDDTEY